MDFLQTFSYFSISEMIRGQLIYGPNMVPERPHPIPPSPPRTRWSPVKIAGSPPVTWDASSRQMEPRLWPGVCTTRTPS